MTLQSREMYVMKTMWWLYGFDFTLMLVWTEQSHVGLIAVAFSSAACPCWVNLASVNGWINVSNVHITRNYKFLLLFCVRRIQNNVHFQIVRCYKLHKHAVKLQKHHQCHNSQFILVHKTVYNRCHVKHVNSAKTCVNIKQKLQNETSRFATVCPQRRHMPNTVHVPLRLSENMRRRLKIQIHGSLLSCSCIRIIKSSYGNHDDFLHNMQLPCISLVSFVIHFHQ